MADDEFLNPQQVKRNIIYIYMDCSTLICNIAYFVMTIIISFLLLNHSTYKNRPRTLSISVLGLISFFKINLQIS